MDSFEEHSAPEKGKTDRWEGFLTNIGQGIALVLLSLAIIILYRGCNGAETLLPPLQ